MDSIPWLDNEAQVVNREDRLALVIGSLPMCTSPGLP